MTPPEADDVQVARDAGLPAAESGADRALALAVSRLADVGELASAESLVVFTEVQAALQTALADLSRR